MMFILRYLILFSFLVAPLLSYAQTDASIQGYVRDSLGKPIPYVHVVLEPGNFITITSEEGFYILRAQGNKTYTISFSCVGYQTIKQSIHCKLSETLKMDITLRSNTTAIGEVSITSEVDRASSVNRISIKDFNQLPNPAGGIESLIKTLPGVSSSNELSSLYSVRGGNFDENLVYVNDIELNRPFLIRSGQQEGLSFINSDMVSSVKFSAGGFEARYGDKMSSVLDVSYRKPLNYQCRANASLLSGGATVEGVSKNHKFSHISSIRYKTSQYLLNTFETKGEYHPFFTDIQSLVTYQPLEKVEFSFLGNYAQNKYQFVPETRSTNFGTVDQVYNLKVYYDGQELDKYRSTLGALTANYHPSNNLSLKVISSAYASYEQETFDINGAYSINELDNTAGSDTYGDSLLNIGVGEMLNHARNFLWANTWLVAHIGTYTGNHHIVKWSAEYKREQIVDRLNEWTVIDSAGYFSPYSPTAIVLNDFAESKNNITSTRISGYLMDTWQFGSDKTRFYLTGGIRVNYWDFNKELLISPRLRLSINPGWKRDFMFHLATGVYNQPPLYKEMRDFHGKLNANIKAQRSIHVVLGSDYNLQIWERPFKITSEIFYKHLDRLIPYKVDNVRIRYTAQNNASGYATGLDMKINGEFVPGVESWASLSFLKTEEDQNNDYYINSEGERIEPGYYPRPTDQRVICSVFFQDYLPNNSTWQMHLNLAYGSPIRVSPPRSARFDQTFKMGPYRRVDMGLSKILIDSDNPSKVKFLRLVKEFIISLEFFNLLDIHNKASYLWVTTVPNQENMPNEFAVPNYLTSRRVNLKISVKI